MFPRVQRRLLLVRRSGEHYGDDDHVAAAQLRARQTDAKGRVSSVREYSAQRLPAAHRYAARAGAHRQHGQEGARERAQQAVVKADADAQLRELRTMTGTGACASAGSVVFLRVCSLLHGHVALAPPGRWSAARRRARAPRRPAACVVGGAPPLFQARSGHTRVKTGDGSPLHPTAAPEAAPLRRCARTTAQRSLPRRRRAVALPHHGCCMTAGTACPAAAWPSHTPPGAAQVMDC
jgi:hypothetical protein